MHEEIVKTLEQYKQFHIIEHIKTLTETERAHFLANLSRMEMDLVFTLYNSYKDHKEKKLNISPPHVISLPKTDIERAFGNKAKKTGEELLRKNKVSVLIVAGGQGTRLGFNGPKGTFPITPIKQKSFFQLFAEQVVALSKKYNATIPLLIMTSEENHNNTLSFFKENNYFGLNKDFLFFFMQEMIPTLSESGKLILKGKDKLITNPDGHGGSLKAIYKYGLLEQLLSMGYSYLFYCQVDNPLVKIADPVFLGYHAITDADVSTKVVRRRSVEEKVGIYVVLNGKDAIIEYSDMDKKYMEAVDEKGEIVFWAGNTAIHVFSLDFIKRLNFSGFALPYHMAKKKIEIKTGDSVEEMDVLKFETFVFDAIPLANKTCVMEVIREEEFSPVKNRTGLDSPETAQKDMCNLYRRWLESTGVYVRPHVKVEISPLFAIDCHDFKSKYRNENKIIETDIYIGE